ncbi:MAG: RtcB family protein [Candidatus Latescibacterota bacterium]|nr:RtcB family protein [Candidatus Latescibacterota bacterium]
MQKVKNVPVWGVPLENAVEQMAACAGNAEYVALMADHHLGYSVPIGGVLAYDNQVSPSAVGFDIACGNKAVRLDAEADYVQGHIAEIMDEIFAVISFGIGRNNPEPVEAELFASPTWDDVPVAGELRALAREQLGTVGSGNHYVDVFVDGGGAVWVGVHFGSRGLGHKLATHFVKAGGGKDGMHVAPVCFDLDGELGQQYWACMELAGQYAYAGRDWVCDRVAEIVGGGVVDSVHNHHNFAWKERHFDRDLVVIRKGATPCQPCQRSFVGGSMGDISVIIEGREAPESASALYSTVHGAGRVMSRTRAAGRKRWRKGKLEVKSSGQISRAMMEQWIAEFNRVELRGAGTDESPHVYKRLPEVLEFHEATIKVLHSLMPIGVAMAGADEFDPYRD